jgi:hypothetical protein
VPLALTNLLHNQPAFLLLEQSISLMISADCETTPDAPYQ